MTLTRPLALLACFTMPLWAEDTADAAKKIDATPTPDAATIKKNSSYAFGYQNGIQFSRQLGGGGLTIEDLDKDQFSKGFFEAFAGKELGIPEADLQSAMEGLQKLVEAREKKLAEKNLEASKNFLAENGKREGVTTTKSGLQYEVLTKGSDVTLDSLDKEIKESPEFKVIYKGTLTDGTVFDQSPAGQPVAIDMNVIEGFKEALSSMPKGAKWKVTMPPALAYGEQRAGTAIAPNSVLIFELELLDIVKKAPAPQGGFPFPGAPGQ